MDNIKAFVEVIVSAGTKLRVYSRAEMNQHPAPAVCPGRDE